MLLSFCSKQRDNIMPNNFQGNLYANADDKFCIIVARFNEFIGSKLLSGAIDSFVRLGVDEKNIDVITPATGELIRKWVEGGVEVGAVNRPIRADKFVQVYSDDCMVLTKKGFESIKNLPVDTLAQMAAHQNYALAATAITDFLDAKAVAMTDDGSAEATEIDDLVNELPNIEDQASKVDGPIG